MTENLRPAIGSQSRGESFARAWFAPALGPLLRQRTLAAVLGAIGVVQVAAGVWHFHTFPCPMLRGTGIPCPGCGASRGCGALLRGDWHTYLAMHVMAPFFLAAVALFLTGAALPARRRLQMASLVDGIEGRTGIVKLLLLLLLLYWIARLVYAPAEFARQMRGW